MTPHADRDTEPQTKDKMGSNEAPLTNGETPSSRILSVCIDFFIVLNIFSPPLMILLAQSGLMNSTSF